MERERSVTSPASPFASTVASSWPRKHTLPSSPKRTMSPTASRFAGLHEGAPARAVEPLVHAIGLDRRLLAAPMRRPESRAGITRVSLTTSASPGRSRSGRSRTTRSSSRVAPGRTTSSRAASRGRAGRSAIRSGGRSKSNRSVRIRRCHPGSRVAAIRDPCSTGIRPARSVVRGHPALASFGRDDDGD